LRGVVRNSVPLYWGNKYSRCHQGVWRNLLDSSLFFRDVIFAIYETRQLAQILHLSKTLHKLMRLIFGQLIESRQYISDHNLFLISLGSHLLLPKGNVSLRSKHGRSIVTNFNLSMQLSALLNLDYDGLVYYFTPWSMLY